MKSLDKRTVSGPRFSFSETVADGGTSDPVIIASERVTATLIPGSGAGKIQYTTSPDADIEGETANWQDWDHGAVTASASILFAGPVTGLRAVSTGGAIDWELVA